MWEGERKMDRDSATVAAIKQLGCSCEELPCPLISWLVSELRKADPDVRDGADRCAVLAAELKELLDLLFYPHGFLSSETLSPTHLSRITDFLVSELQAAWILLYKKNHPEEDNEPQTESGKEQRSRDGKNADKEEEEKEEEVLSDRDENEVMKELAQLFQVLDMNPDSRLSDAALQVELLLVSLPDDDGLKPLLTSDLSSSQWRKVHLINEALRRDYECRRRMMMKRFTVTLQSFTWGERGTERGALLSSIPPFSAPPQSSVTVEALLAARRDRSRILPVRAGPSTAVHKVLMGSVPDRGGRPREIEPPMPAFTRHREGGEEQRREKNKFQRRDHSGRKKKNKNR